MPKKFAGENSKAVAAKARKEEKKKDEESRKQKAAEDEYWKDDDKLINRKTQRKVPYTFPPISIHSDQLIAP